jgi:release factor glutamine methyltransferase|tara:strand:- start:414 stop:1265 length:852 start_codon:yes stop_codon:yes gene_type:complete
MNTSVSNFSREIGAQLKFAGIDDYPIESRQLISYCMDWTQTQYLSSLNLPIDDGKRKRIEALVKRRISREPIQYILGSASFYGRTFSVNPNVLIPRPETELLVEQIIKFVKETNLKEPKILDICTGSGIIAISLAKELPSSNVTATDISEEAIEVAKLNALRHQADINFIRENCTESISGYYDIFVSNPPYIETSAIDSLQPEIHLEPRIALDGGIDGTDILVPIIKNISNAFHKKRTAIFLEIDPAVSEKVVEVSRLYFPKSFIDVINDFTGLKRILTIQQN